MSIAATTDIRNLNYYRCTWEWCESIGYPDGCFPEQYNEEYKALRQILWQRHYAALPDEDRAIIEGDECAERNAEQVMQCLPDLKASLKRLYFVENIGLGHDGQRFVYCVSLLFDIYWKDYFKVIPDFYRGVPVMVYFPGSSPGHIIIDHGGRI